MRPGKKAELEKNKGSETQRQRKRVTIVIVGVLGRCAMVHKRNYSPSWDARRVCTREITVLVGVLDRCKKEDP
jgi:hypothetical protein